MEEEIVGDKPSVEQVGTSSAYANRIEDWRAFKKLLETTDETELVSLINLLQKNVETTRKISDIIINS